MTTFNELNAYVKMIADLPTDQREVVRIMFHNPTDGAEAAFEVFAEWDGIEVLDRIIQTAKALGIEHAGLLEDRFLEWSNREASDAGQLVLTEPASGEVDGTLDENERRARVPQDYVGDVAMQNYIDALPTENAKAEEPTVEDRLARLDAKVEEKHELLSAEIEEVRESVSGLTELDVNDIVTERDVERAIEELGVPGDFDFDSCVMKDDLSDYVTTDDFESRLDDCLTKDDVEEEVTRQLTPLEEQVKALRAEVDALRAPRPTFASRLRTMFARS